MPTARLPARLATMFAIPNYFRTLPKRQMVRPWALAVPILVLLVALPMLRPLRYPASDQMSPNELTRLAAIQSLAENHTQEIEGSQFYATLRQRDFHAPPETVRIQNHVFSDKAPVLAVILSGVYWLFLQMGLTFQNSPALAIYFLTIVCAVIPVASAAGMVYRMGRLFELRRPFRAMLALAVTFGSGLISYAVVLNAHAPAAALILAACACLVHITVTQEPPNTGAWLMVSGLCAALAAVIDPSAIIFLVGLVLVILNLRWRKSLRFGAVMLYVIGTLPPLLLHTVLTVPITGDLLPAGMHSELRPGKPQPAAIDPYAEAGDEEGVSKKGWIHSTVARTAEVIGALIGAHGIFSHFPVLLIGVMGLVLVLRRHWPIATKTMAAVTLSGGGVVLVSYVFFRTDPGSGMFGPRWAIAFLPLLLFWSGAWLRKSHHPITWAVASVMLLFSIGVSLLGTTAPFLNAPDQYGVTAAYRQFMHPQPPTFNRAIVAQN